MPKYVKICLLRIRTFSTVFQIGCTILHSCQPCMGVPVTILAKSCSSQAFKILDALVGVQRYFIVVLICIFLMDNDVKHFFRVFFFNVMPLPVFCPLKKIDYLYFFLLICRNSLYSEFLSDRCKTEGHLIEIISCVGVVSDLAHFFKKGNNSVLAWIIILHVQKRDSVY